MWGTKGEELYRDASKRENRGKGVEDCYTILKAYINADVYLTKINAKDYKVALRGSVLLPMRRDLTKSLMKMKKMTWLESLIINK